MIDANMGYNGSENFAEGKRFGFFPSVSAVSYTHPGGLRKIRLLVM